MNWVWKWHVLRDYLAPIWTRFEPNCYTMDLHNVLGPWLYRSPYFKFLRYTFFCRISRRKNPINFNGRIIPLKCPGYLHSWRNHAQIRVRSREWAQNKQPSYLGLCFIDRERAMFHSLAGDMSGLKQDVCVLLRQYLSSFLSLQSLTRRKFIPKK